MRGGVREVCDVWCDGGGRGEGGERMQTIRESAAMKNVVCAEKWAEPTHSIAKQRVCVVEQMKNQGKKGDRRKGGRRRVKQSKKHTNGCRGRCSFRSFVRSDDGQT